MITTKNLKSRLCDYAALPLQAHGFAPPTPPPGLAAAAGAALEAARVVYPEIEAAKRALSNALEAAKPGDLAEIKQAVDLLADRELACLQGVARVAAAVEARYNAVATEAAADRDKAIAELMAFLQKRFGIATADPTAVLAARFIQSAPLVVEAVSTSHAVGFIGRALVACRERAEALNEWKLESVLL